MKQTIQDISEFTLATAHLNQSNRTLTTTHWTTHGLLQQNKKKTEKSLTTSNYQQLNITKKKLGKLATISPRPIVSPSGKTTPPATLNKTTQHTSETTLQLVQPCPPHTNPSNQHLVGHRIMGHSHFHS